MDSASTYQQTRAYEPNRDLLTEMTTQFGTATPVARYDYTYNALGQRESAKQSGAAFADFGNATYYRYAYNAKGELTQAAGYLGTDVNVTSGNGLPGRNFQYGYDVAGNRTSANSTGNTAYAAAYTPNSLNQITARENLYVPVSGTVDADAGVVVNGQLAGRQGKYWSTEVLLNNNSGPVYTNSLQAKAAKAGAAQVGSLLAAFLPAANETITYDADGNVTADGQWDYTWDAENRLTKMETRSIATAVGLPGQRLVFRYDSTGRRTVKEVWTWSGSAWSLAKEVRFVYQGWNVIAELNSSGTRQRTYAWGLDTAGSLTATGGVGALLQEVDHTGTVTAYLPAYTGNGDVAAVADTSGNVVAAYEYSPFGEALRAEGAQAKKNPFRYSTKYTDDETGLVYYGMRYYSPSLGRFLGRDPSGEQGGLNLYRFCNNDPVNGIDLLGMLTVEEYSAQLAAMTPEERAWMDAASVWWAENGQGGTSAFDSPVNLSSLTGTLMAQDAADAAQARDMRVITNGMMIMGKDADGNTIVGFTNSESKALLAEYGAAWSAQTGQNYELASGTLNPGESLTLSYASGGGRINTTIAPVTSSSVEAPNSASPADMPGNGIIGGADKGQPNYLDAAARGKILNTALANVKGRLPDLIGTVTGSPKVTLMTNTIYRNGKALYPGATYVKNGQIIVDLTINGNTSVGFVESIIVHEFTHAVQRLNGTPVSEYDAYHAQYEYERQYHDSVLPIFGAYLDSSGNFMSQSAFESAHVGRTGNNPNQTVTVTNPYIVR